MAYEWAKPGVKCVCISSTAQTGVDYRGVNRIPVRNEVLTIRDAVPTEDGTIILLFQEIRNPKVPTTEGVMERGYAISHFRPVHTIDSDSEMFKRISEDSLGRLEVLEEVLNELAED